MSTASRSIGQNPFDPRMYVRRTPECFPQFVKRNTNPPRLFLPQLPPAFSAPAAAAPPPKQEVPAEEEDTPLFPSAQRCTATNPRGDPDTPAAAYPKALPRPRFTALFAALPPAASAPVASSAPEPRPSDTTFADSSVPDPSLALMAPDSAVSIPYPGEKPMPSSSDLRFARLGMELLHSSAQRHPTCPTFSQMQDAWNFLHYFARTSPSPTLRRVMQQAMGARPLNLKSRADYLTWVGLLHNQASEEFHDPLAPIAQPAAPADE